MEDNFLTQLIREPTREGAPLDLFFANTEGLVDDVMVGGRLGQRNHEIIKFSVIGELRKCTSRTATLEFWKTDLFRAVQEAG